MRILVTLLLLSTSAFAQNQVRTVTRSVLQFGDLERKLAAAPQAERANYLSDDFEERLCAEPGTPIARNEWLAQPAPRFSYRQEAVHDLGDASVFSALALNGDSQYSVVDVWRKDGNTYKLAIRYLCPATGSKPSPSIPKRY